MRAFVVVACLAWATVPAAQTPPLVPPGIRPVTAPVEYRAYWDAAVREFGHRPATTFENIVWYVTPGSGFPCAEGPTCFGRWIHDGYHPYVILAEGAVHDRAKVVHEMIHAILGNGRHSCEFEQLRRALGATP